MIQRKRFLDRSEELDPINYESEEEIIQLISEDIKPKNVKARFIGGTLCITIPVRFVKTLNVTAGDYLQVSRADNGISINIQKAEMERA